MTPYQKGKHVVVVERERGHGLRKMCPPVGAEEVTIVYRREEEMPARAEEIEHAKEEGSSSGFSQIL